MSANATRHALAVLPLLLVALTLGGAPASAVAQPDFDVVHLFDGGPRQPLGGLIRGSDGALYGTASSGGPGNAGLVFKVHEDGSGFASLHDFDYATGASPSAALVLGSDAALYGTTFSGGASGVGVIFKVTEDGSSFTILHDFDYVRGGYPRGGLIVGSDGALYGTAVGGASGNGVVFRITQDGSSFTILHDFSYSDGATPNADVVIGSDGALYGTTSSGGVLGQGTVFRITEDGSTFGTIHDFDGAGGAYPFLARLVRGPDGLYGTTSQGGVTNQGIVFKVSEDGATFAKLHDFDGAQGSYPLAGLSAGSDGALYGTTSQGGAFGIGVVFRILADGSAFSMLHSFDNAGGYYPQGAALLSGSDASLFGVAPFGGSTGNGVVFKVKEDGSAFATVLVFGPISGAQPSAGLLKGGDRALYGTTVYGGTANVGVVFKVNEDGSGFATLHDFDGTSGANPSAALTKGTDGALYGVTASGGQSGQGVVFKIREDGTGFAKLHDFDGGDGASPYGSLFLGSDGLFGTTRAGGAGGVGVIFKISEDGLTFTKVRDFDGTGGAYPWAGLVRGSDGALYGTTSQGGGLGFGVIFKVREDGSDFIKLHDFDYNTTGAYPEAALLKGPGDVLFGTASGTGGLVFRITEGGTFTKLRDFDPARGSSPQTLIKGSDGALYGLGRYGGQGAGVVFKISEDGSYFARVHAFNYAQGAGPSGALLEGSDGAFYGTAQYGGPASGGVVFRVVPGPDTDGDEWLDSSDNCPAVFNPDQADTDFDGIGNACDSDNDNDGTPDATDNCPLAFNPDQLNRFGGPAGDACDDTDADAVLDLYDNCPLVSNPTQADRDFDGRGDACDDSRISISDVAINEENSGTVSAGFIVTLSPASASAVTVQYQTTPGTATAGSDYTAIAPTILTFSPGQTAKAVTVKVRGDVRDEDDELYFVDLSAPVGATLARSRGLGIILDDDPTPSLSVNSPWIVEGATNKNLVFTVTLSAPSGKTVSVAYATADGGAIAPSDYIPESGQITFAPGQTSRPVSITIRGDLVHEFDEIFSLHLFGVVNASLANDVGFAVIQDDDPDPATVQATIGDATVTEGDTGTVNAVFVVSLSPPATQVVKVDYATMAGTAEAGADFTPKSGTLTFQVGQTAKTISVPVKGDLNEEQGETFFVNLSNPQGLAILDGQGAGTIANDDGPPEIVIADKAITEGNAGSKTLTLTVSLSATSFLPVTVAYATAETGSGAGFATPDVDYVSKSGILTIDPGEKTGSIGIAIKGDRLAEGPETFVLNLASPMNATIGDGQALATILDNEP